MPEHGDVWRSPCGAIELRCGDWQTVLADVERVDAVITDPPYSERTHKGHDSASAHDSSGAPRDNRKRQAMGLGPLRRAIGYGAWGRADVDAFTGVWSPRAGWIVALTDHALSADWAGSLDAEGRYTFAPLACVEPGSRVRLAGDGPSQWACWAVASRPRSLPWSKWGTLAGAYVVPPGHGDGKKRGIVGGKPLWLMRAIVRDYSRPGDLVCDPCAGGATTLLAAAMEGRRAIGAELDPATFSKAVKRLEKGWTTSLLTGLEAPRAEQMALGGTDGE